MAYNFDVSILNPLRFFQLSDSLGASGQTINYATFDANYQTRDFDKDFFARNIPSYDRQTTYCQPYQQGDVLRVQFLGLQNDGTTNQYLLDIVDLKGQSVLTASPTQGLTPISGQYITEFSVPLIGIPEGEYFAVIRFRKLQGLSYVFTYVISEPISVAQSHPNTLLYEYANSYNTQGIIFEELSAPFHFRVHSALTELNPDSKFTTYEDEPLNLEMLSGTPYRLWTLGIGGNGNPIPQWVADKIERITLCDTLKIDGKLYTRNEGAKLEANRKQRTPLYSWKITLREKINDNNLYISDYQQNKIITADVVEGAGMIYARDLVTTTTYQIRQFFNGYTGLLQYLNGQFKLLSGLGGTFGIDANSQLVYTPSSSAEATQFASPSLKILPYTLEVTTTSTAIDFDIEPSGTTTYAINYNDGTAISYGTISVLTTFTKTYTSTKEKTFFVAVDKSESVSMGAPLVYSLDGYLAPETVGVIAYPTLTAVGNIFKFCTSVFSSLGFADCGLPQSAIDSVLKSIYLNEKIVNATIDLQQTPDTPCSNDVAKNIVPYIIGRGNIVYLDNQFVPASPVNVALPLISGTPQPANNLTCSNGTWTGYPTPNYTRKWQQSTNGGLTWNDFSPQQTGVTYAVQTGDIGSQIRCIVTAQNSQGVVSATANPVSITSALVGSAPYPTASPVISGTTLVGSVLTTTDGTWGGTTPITFAYQWLREGQTIIGATSNTYTTVSADAGMFIQCRVTATNTQSNSNVSNAIIPTIAPSNLIAPSVTGTTVAGATLGTVVGTWAGFPTPSTFTFNWQRSTNGGATWSNLGVTTQTYVVVSGDEGNLVRVQVTASNGISPNATANSNTVAIPTPTVQRPENTVAPVVTGNPYIGQVLTTTNGTWTGSPSGYSYQWFRGTTPIGTNANTYTLVTADTNFLITCRVTATNAGGSEPQLSNEIFAYDADFYAVILYALSQSYTVPTVAQQQHFSRMVKDLKDNSMWSNMDRFFVMAQNGGSNFGRINWRTPNLATELSIANAGAFLSNNGYLLNGTTQWLSSNFTPSVNGVNYTLNNAGRYAYMMTRTASQGVNYAMDGNATQNNNYRRLVTSAQNEVKINGTANLAAALFTNHVGYMAITRADATNINNYVDTPTINTQAQASVSLPSEVQWIGRNAAIYYGGYIGWYALGGAIPVGDLITHKNIITKYFTNL